VSPWPIIISAEMHCSVPQQDMIAEILIEVFGSALIRVGPEDKGDDVAQSGKAQGEDIVQGRRPLPLFLELIRADAHIQTKDVTALRQESTDGADVFSETSGTSSASDSDALQEAALDVGGPGVNRRVSNCTRSTASGSGANTGGSPVVMISPKITFSPLNPSCAHSHTARKARREDVLEQER
jgi:phosphatidylinositol phospholipase C delta